MDNMDTFIYYDYIMHILYNKDYETDNIVSYNCEKYKSKYYNLCLIDKLYREFIDNNRNKTSIEIKKTVAYELMDIYPFFKEQIDSKGLEDIYYMFYNYNYCSPMREICINSKIYTKYDYMNFFTANGIRVTLDKVYISNFIDKLFGNELYVYVLTMRDM